MNKKVGTLLEKQLNKMLFQLVADIDSAREAKTFLTDFLTKKDFENMVQRLAVLYWLRKGRSDENIIRNLKVDRSFIKSAKLIQHRKGVKKALKRVEAEEWANVWERRIKKLTRKK